MSNFIHSREERERIKQQKETKILNFLGEETYSTSEMVGYLLNTTRVTAYRTLKKMELQSLVKRHEVGYDLRKQGKQMIWGLTPTGALLAADLESKEFKVSYYEVGKVKPITMAHSLDIQRVKVIAFKNGWSNWKSSRTLLQEAQSEKGKWLQIPDSFAICPKGYKTALEIERTAKTPKRYDEILSNYANMLSQNTIDKVIYICPEKLTKRLHKLFSSIKKITVNGKVYPVPESLLARFQFVSYEEWGSL